MQFCCPSQHSTRCLHPWRTLIVRALPFLAAIVLNLELQILLSDKNYLSFLDGVDLCKQLSGTQHTCLDLSLDLSSDLSLTCNSREPIL